MWYPRMMLSVTAKKMSAHILSFPNISAWLPFPDTQHASLSLTVLSGYNIVRITLVGFDVIPSISD